MMPSKPSNGPARAQKMPPRAKRAVSNTKTGKAAKRKTASVRGIDRPVYRLGELKRAFREACKTPQARLPKTRYARSKATAVSTLRLRDQKNESHNPQMVTEGSLERLFLKQKEIDPEIYLTVAQPFVIDFEGHLGLGQFTMDFACYPRYGKPYAVDVKQKSALDSFEYGPLVAARKLAFQSVGYELKTPTEEDIKVDPKCSNLLQLYACLSHEQRLLKKAARQLDEALIAAGGVAPLRAFLSQLPPRTVKWGTAYGLYSGLFFADHSAPFGSDFIISKENHHD